MIKQICILTKSYKHGGYCVAGIDIKTGQWIRLVNSDNPENDEIKKEQMILNGNTIECLNVIEYNFVKNIPNLCQTENWLLNLSYKPKFIKSITLEQLINLVKIEKDDCFIFNDSNLLNTKEILSIKRSLYLFYMKNLKIEATTYESYGEIKFRYKCSFIYNNKTYTNISLTDPVYRDIYQNGLSLEKALIIASLPSIPYNDMYYKFVAKIFPIDESLSLYVENLENKNINTIDTIKDLSSPFTKFDLVVKTQQTPGKILFENYDQLKVNIKNGVNYYSQFEYSLDNYQIALKHCNELKNVKNILEKTKREILNNYNKPLELVEKRLDELIDLIKIPFKKVDTFIKQNEKNVKKYEIYLFAKNTAISNGLEDHMENIFKSPSFFDLKWLNISCTASIWKTEILVKIKKIANDIKYILSLQNDNIPMLLANYYQHLSLQQVDEFLNSLKAVSSITKNINTNNNQQISDTNKLSNKNKYISDQINQQKK